MTGIHPMHVHSSPRTNKYSNFFKSSLKIILLRSLILQHPRVSQEGALS